MADEDIDYARGLGRNVAVGLVLVYAGTTGLCYAALGQLGQALAIAVVPALFAGPYLGLLITLIGAVAPKRAVEGPAVAVEVAQPTVTAAGVGLVRDAAA